MCHVPKVVKAKRPLDIHEYALSLAFSGEKLVNVNIIDMIAYK